jgi:non-specific serine/threonine protein kinase
LAIIADRRGDAPRAAALYRESLNLARDHRDLQQIAAPLDRLAIHAGTAGQDESAARLFGAAARLHELLGRPADRAAGEDHERADAGARTRLGDERFGAAWAAGQALPLDDAVAEALRVEAVPIAPAPHSPTDSAARSGLTRRERDVLRLLVAGHTDREIAAALFIGRRTVETHVAGILNKLGLDSRTAVAAHAVRRGLPPSHCPSLRSPTETGGFVPPPKTP